MPLLLDVSLYYSIYKEYSIYFLIQIYIYLLCVCVYVCTCGYTDAMEHMEIKGQLLGVGSLLLPSGFWGGNVGH